MTAQSDRTFFLLFGLYSLGMFFVAPVYPLFLLSRGLDLLEINLVLAIFLVTIFLLEVPTGAIADRFGRRFSFLLACAIRAVAFTLYAFADSFLDCVVAEIVDGVGTTLASGALEAWAVDARREERAEGSLERLFARSQVISRVAMIGGGILCAGIASIDWGLAWLTGASAFVVTGVLAWGRMHEPPRAGTAAMPASLGRTIAEGLALARSTPIVLLLCGLTAGLFFAVMPLHMLWQPRLRELGMGELWVFGWIWALLSLAALVGSAILPRVLGHLRRDRVLFFSTLWRGGLLAAAALSTLPLPMLVVFLLQEIGFGLSEPVFQAWLNEHVPDERRATLISVRSMFGTLGGALGLVLVGTLARDAGIPAAWLVSAAVFAVLAPGFLLLGRLGARPVPREPVVEIEPVPAKVMPPTVE